MISLQNIPPLVVFAKNPLPLQFKATDSNGNPFRAVGAMCIVKCEGPVFAEGSFFNFSWIDGFGNSNAVSLRCSDIVQNESHIPATIANVPAVMNAHHRIAPFFKVYYEEQDYGDYHVLFIEAKNVTEQYILTCTLTAPQPTPYNIYIVAPQANTTPNGYRCYVNLYFEDDYKKGTWSIVAQDALFLDDNGKFPPLDIAPILERECARSQTENPFAAYSYTEPRISDNMRRFRVEFKEFYYGNTTQAYFSTQTITAVNGGVPPRQFIQTGYDYFASLNFDTSFITYKPEYSRIRKGQPAYISWFNYTNTDLSVRLNITGKDANGLLVNVLHTQTYIDTPPSVFVTFPITAEMMEGLEILYVQVMDATNGDAYTRDFAFTVDNEYYKRIVTLGYINAIGLPEVFICTGLSARNVEVSRTLYEAMRTDSAGRTLPMTRQNKSVIQFDWTYRTGYMNTAQSFQFTEVFASRVLFDMTNYVQIALVFKGTQKAKIEDAESQQGFELNVKPQIDLVNFAMDLNFTAAEVVKDAAKSKDLVSDKGNGGGGNGGGGTNGGLQVVQVSAIADTDLVVFLRVNPTTGATEGLAAYPSTKYKRDVRGISHDTKAHTDALKLGDRIITLDEQNQVNFDKE